jgi:hypothetical protein
MVMFDGIFFINHALNVKQLSVFNNEERFKQTLDTLDSIDKHCPNNVKIIFDNSPHDVDESYLKVIGEWKNTWFLDMGKHEGVQLLSLNGLRSQAECYSFMGFLEWFKQQNFLSKRIYKLSGRYKLTDDFVLDDPSYKDAFVFATALNSWYPKEKQNLAGVDKLFRLRLWHMDYNLLKTFEETLPIIFDDCNNYGIDVEHSYYKHLHKHKIVEVSKIGVTGYIAPSGEFIDE